MNILKLYYIKVIYIMNGFIKVFYKTERISRTKPDGFKMIFEQTWEMKIIIDLKVLMNIILK